MRFRVIIQVHPVFTKPNKHIPFRALTEWNHTCLWDHGPVLETDVTSLYMGPRERRLGFSAYKDEGLGMLL